MALGEGNLRDQLRAFAAGDISDAALIRRLVQHRRWFVAATPSGNRYDVCSYMATGDAECLWLFSDSDAAGESSQEYGADAIPCVLSDVDGVDLLGGIPVSYARVVVNPSSQQSVEIERERYPALHRMSQAVTLERAIAKPDGGERFRSLLKNYDNYQVVYRPRPGQPPALLGTHNDEGESFVLIFTESDCTEAFFDHSSEQRHRMDVRRLAGTELFQLLPHTMLTGMVFNCHGPGPSAAFKMEICGKILAAV